VSLEPRNPQPPLGPCPSGGSEDDHTVLDVGTTYQHRDACACARQARCLRDMCESRQRNHQRNDLIARLVLLVGADPAPGLSVREFLLQRAQQRRAERVLAELQLRTDNDCSDADTVVQDGDREDDEPPPLIQDPDYTSDDEA
jgi:hypothetical protein